MVETREKRRVLSMIFSFFLSFFLFLLMVSCVFRITFLSFDFLQEEINSSNYYGNLIDELESEFTSYGAASGFDKSAFQEVLDSGQVKMDASSEIARLYSGSADSIDINRFQDTLLKSLVANAKARGINVSENDSALRYLTSECADTYRQHLQIPYASILTPVLKKMSGLSNVILLVSFLLTLLCVGFLCLLNRWRHRIVRYCIFGVSGSFLMLLVPPIAALASGRIQKLSFTAPSLYHLGVSYLTAFFQMFFRASAVLAALLLILGLIYYSLEQKIKKGEG